MPLDEAEACSGREVHSTILGFFSAPFDLEENSVRVEVFTAEVETGEAQVIAEVLQGEEVIGEPVTVKIQDLMDTMEKVQTRRWKCMRPDDPTAAPVRAQKQTAKVSEKERAKKMAKIHQ